MTQNETDPVARPLPKRVRRAAPADDSTPVRDTSMSPQALARVEFEYPEEAAAPPPERAHSVRNLAALWLWARQNTDAAWDRLNPAEAAAKAASPPYPDECKAADARYREEYNQAKAVADFAIQWAVERSRIPAYDIWRAKLSAIEAAHGVPALELAATEAANETRKIRDQVFAAPALTVSDLASKVAILFAHMKDEDIDEAEVFAAVTALNRDLEALNTSGGAA